MRKSTNKSSFWTSYSDLMTSMFFIMLTLFILVIAVMHNRMKATEYELNEIKKVINSTKELNRKDNLFIYKPKYKKYVLNVSCFFEPTKTELADLQTDTAKLHRAGNEIREFLLRNKKYQYLLIIEGQASRNDTSWTTRNYDYSFKRALTLMRFWKKVCRVDFGSNCEIQIAGSGDGRYNMGYTGDHDVNDDKFKALDSLLMREQGTDEEKNQRFVIHLIPKNIVNENNK